MKKFVALLTEQKEKKMTMNEQENDDYDII